MEDNKVTIESTKDIIEVDDGVFEGVKYSINSVEVMEDESDKEGTIIKFDYDVYNLDEKDSDAFEKYLGGLIQDALIDFINSENEKMKELSNKNESFNKKE